MIENGIAVIGSTTIDRIIHHHRSWVKAGGVTVYAGITYRRHGVKTLAITNIAARDVQIIERLHKEKIIICNGQTPLTTRFINTIQTGGRRQKNPQRAAPISVKQLRDHVKDVSCVHLGPLHPTDIDARAINALRALELDVILDVQGLVRAVKNETVYPAVSQQLSDALGVSHIVKANAQEYAVMIDFYQTDLRALMQRFGIREFIVTSGANGGFVKQAAAAEIPYAAWPAKSNGDPTGAGDVFLAAYVIGRFLNQQPIAAACEAAAKLVARQIEGDFIKPGDLCLEPQAIA